MCDICAPPETASPTSTPSSRAPTVSGATFSPTGTPSDVPTTVAPTRSPSVTPTCPDISHVDPCSAGQDGRAYRGNVSITTGGHPCQAWASQSPHAHGNTPEANPCTGLDGGHNYCRSKILDKPISRPTDVFIPADNRAAQAITKTFSLINCSVRCMFHLRSNRTGQLTCLRCLCLTHRSRW